MDLLPGSVRVVEDVAGAFANTVVEAFATRPDPLFTLVLSGGPTAERCYQELAGTPPGTIDWGSVEVLMGDERCVAADHPDANSRLVHRALLEHVGPVGSFHPMCCDDVASYQRLLENHPSLDFVHLGLGPDGHTASLFPGSPALDAPRGSLAVRTADPGQLNPHERMSLTFEAIARARLVVFTVSGESKRAAFSALRAGADLPAARVRATRVLWLVDRSAACPS
jgi:6-phosphogluconolactonase